jgi:hypothetical protein
MGGREVVLGDARVKLAGVLVDRRREGLVLCPASGRQLGPDGAGVTAAVDMVCTRPASSVWSIMTSTAAGAVARAADRAG